MRCNTQADTEALGRNLGERVFRGAFLALWGELGAGKTALCRGIGAALGADDIMSPTFTIVQEHNDGPMLLFHFDVYRLSDATELEDMGYADYLAKNGVIVMEWPENVIEALPCERLDIRIEGSGDLPRLITMQAHGKRHAAMIEAMREETI